MKTNRQNRLIAGLMSIGLCMTLSATASAGHSYTLKGEAPTGTLIKSPLAKANVPFNKHYYELSESERDSYRARFDSLESNQVPPFPRNGLRDVYRPLIEANELGKPGRLNINLDINEQGQVENIQLIDAPSKELAAASEKILRSMQFNPAYCAGDPCSMTFPIKITYK